MSEILTDDDDMIAELEDGRAVLVAKAGQPVTDELLERLGLERAEVKRRGDTALAATSVKIIAVHVSPRDRLNLTTLDVCSSCGHAGYSPSDPLRLVDSKTGQECCPWGCANRARFADLEGSWAVLRAHPRSGVAWQLETLLRRQHSAEMAPYYAARAEAWREELKAKHEEAVRRQAELDKLDPEERARRARELSW